MIILKKEWPVVLKFLRLHPRGQETWSWGELSVIYKNHPDCWNTRMFLLITFLLITPLSLQANNCGNSGPELVNLSKKISQDFQKTKSAEKSMSTYRVELEKKMKDLMEFGEKNPKCQNELRASAEEAQKELSGIFSQMQKVASTDCSKMKYRDFPALHAYAKTNTLEKTEIRKRDEIRQQLCQQMTCMMKQDHLSFVDFKKKVLQDAESAPIKKKTDEAFDQLNLKTCAK